MKRYLFFLFIVIPILALLAFGLQRDPRVLPSVLVGKNAPDFSLQTLEGKRVTLQSFSGQPLVINFWATWCGPCFYEHPILKEGRDIYEKEGVKFLGVVYQDQKENVIQFLKEMGEPFLVLLDPQNEMAISYGVGGVPETFFVDGQGIIRSKIQGALTLATLDLQLKNLLPIPKTTDSR